MKIGILTSSRADFGIYSPLVKELYDDDSLKVEIIAFGAHLKEEYGYTIDEIIKQGFDVKHQLKTLVKNDAPGDISKSIGDAILKFSDFWENYNFDLVFALGDRYEMFAAVSAASPFNITIAHIHAGETTLGAIDNAYRHSISLMSKYQFVSTEEYKRRAIEVIGSTKNVYNVGALSIDNLMKQEFFSLEDFKNEFEIDLSIPSILSTFHPETVSYDKNEVFIDELISSFRSLQDKYQIIITMPNSDTMGDSIRRELVKFGSESKNVKLIESFGMKGYLTVMKYCKMLLGNSSSGFVEAAFFPKWVINLGDRQKGRIITDNIINTKIIKQDILNSVKLIENSNVPVECNIYGTGNTVNKIIRIIKYLYELK